MHKTGVRMMNEVIRDGEVIHKGAADFFEFDQQGSFQVQQGPYQVEPGDSFRTTCYYRDGNKFGLSSQEEMCIAFLLYYPVKKISGIEWICGVGVGNTGIDICEEAVSRKDSLKVKELGREFGNDNSQCPSSSPTISPATCIEKGGTCEENDDCCSGRCRISKCYSAYTPFSKNDLKLRRPSYSFGGNIRGR